MPKQETNPLKIIIICLMLFIICSGFRVFSVISPENNVYLSNNRDRENSHEKLPETRGTYANIKLWDDLGENAEDRFGMSVASAGDIDNDSYDDFIVGVKYNDDSGMDAGKVYIYRGGQSTSNNPFWQKRGEAWNHKFGTSVASAGDVNGDGFNDVIIGAPTFRDGNTYKGKAYIFLGGDPMGGSAFWTCIGEEEGDEYGCSVASAGDVNNDGFDDVIVGAKEQDGNGNSRGKAYVYLGGIEMSDTPYWQKNGEEDHNNYGGSVASAGNVNGDDYDDIIIGADNNDEGADGAGKAYIHLGGDEISQSPFWERTGEMEYDSFGECVASAGDVNNDGLDDVIIGAPKSDESSDNAGKIYVYLGGTPMGQNSFCEIMGEAKGDEYGSIVASAFNVNGDEFDDIIVGSLFNDDGGNNAGKSYVYLGGITINETAFWTRTGENKEDRFGYSVASAGDVNKDGYDDVIIGALGHDGGGNNAGKGYVYAIMTNNPPKVMNLSIDPMEPRTANNLTARYNFTDTDDDVENGTFIRWYCNGLVVNELYDKQIVHSNYTSKGENWSFTVIPGDGLTTGDPVSAFNRTILNTPPQVNNLRILPNNPKTTDNLSINYTFHDSDNDTESGTSIRWYENGSLVEDYNDLLVIPASATSRNMKWNVSLLPGDGDELGQTVHSSEIIIGNSPPKAYETFIIPSQARTGDNLTAIWNYSDADEDMENETEIKWFRNNLHMYDYDDHHVIGHNATEKNDIWYFTVRPGDGDEYGPSQRSPEITILNTAPTCTASSPMNGTVFFSDGVLLEWNGTDADNDFLTYNVYLDNDNGTNKVVSDLDHTYWESKDLVNGLYYWRVEAFDGEETSKKMSSALSFYVNITAEDFIPAVRLDTPENNSIINYTATVLRWTALGDHATFLRYDVYFGSEKTPPLIAENITSQNYTIDQLKDKTTYYWKIIPRLGDMEGVCIGGTRIFEVKEGFILVHHVALSLERENVRIIRGAVGSVKLEIKNLGNGQESINMSVSGDLKDRIVFTPVFNLGPNKFNTTIIKIITNDQMKTGNYILTIHASYLGGEAIAELEVIIIDELEQTPEKSSGSKWLWSSVIAVILFTILVIIIILIRSRKKKEKSDEMVEDFADIEHVPTGGLKSNIPTAQIIAPKIETSNMAGSIQHGYIRREPMIRGPLENLPSVQSSEGKLSAVGFEQYQMYPSAYEETIQKAVERETPETDADVFPLTNPEAQPLLVSDNETSEVHVSIPSEVQKHLEPLEQAKLPPAANSKVLSRDPE